MAEGQTSLNIREAKKEDLQQLARIANIAFREDPLYAWLFPYRNSTRGEKDFLDWKLNLISSFFYSGIAVFYVAEGIRGCPGFEDGKDLVIGYVMLEWHLRKQLVLRSWTSCKFRLRFP